MKLNRREAFGMLASLATLPRRSYATDELPPTRVVTRGPKFHWRGYYDKVLFSADHRFLLAQQVDFEGRSPKADDIIRIGMIDLKNSDRWIDLGRTSAWNWQQGCMLQWLPGSKDEVAWNDREGERFVMHIKNVVTGKTRSLAEPFYCFTGDSKTAFATDFRRLNDTRPGYGYTGIEDPHRDVFAPTETGIRRIDVATGRAKLIFTFAQAAKLPFTGKADVAFLPESKHWFNHLLMNQDGSRLFFLHRWTRPDRKRAFFTRALTINPDGTDAFILDPHGSTSHFVWRDPKHIFAWAWHPTNGERFYLYEDRTDNVEVIGKDVMTVNGHNTYIPGTENEWVLNDTYPDKQNMQNLYLYHIPSKRRVSLGRFLAPPAYRGEWRCDLHPSASNDGKLVSIDSAHSNGRQVYVIDIEGIIKQT